MRRFKLIYNSIAGQSRFKSHLDAVLEKFAMNDCEVSLFRVSKKSNLEEYVLQNTEEYEGIIIAGGDGTINRVVNIIMKNNLNIPIGVLPAGTSNDFARHLKLPNNYLECVDNIIKGTVIPIDVGKANDKYFINICSAGMFTSASQKVDITLKNIFGNLAYITTGFAQMIRFKPINIKIETENKVIVEKVYLFLVFNGSSAGGLSLMSSEASVQDGFLDIVAIKECGILKSLKVLRKILNGAEHLQDDNVIYLKEKWIKISKLGGYCDDPDVDGEEGPMFPLEIKCISKGINIFYSNN